MEVYFFIGLFLMVINIICGVLVNKSKCEDFYYDKEEESENDLYGLKLVGIIFSIIVFAFGFFIEYLCAGGFVTIFVPIFMGLPIYYYFMFICNSIDLKDLSKKDFFTSMFWLVSFFYMLFIPLAEDVSLSHQISIIISSNIPLLELAIIIYVHLFVYAVVLNVILYFDIYNYVVKKRKISSQHFRRQHSTLSILGFIFSGYISAIILNGQFLNYPEGFLFERFQNIILVYQIFLSSVVILKKINNKKVNKI